MTTSALTIVSSASAVASAAAGGMMFVFSTFVMAGLDRAGPENAVAAMKGINAAAQTSGMFLLAYFGAALLALAMGVTAVVASPPGRGWLLAGAAFGVAGAIVTVAANVPLNDGLDAAAVTPDVWRAYLVSWTSWNHVRTVTSLVAAVLTMVGVVRQ
ncbi:anthrone oxygenase family protein [Mycobacterium sp. C3-094]